MIFRSTLFARSSLKSPVTFQYSKDKHCVSVGLCNTECVCVFVPAWRFETPQQVQFVEKLSDVVIGQLPNFWKLWISYVNGSLFSEVNT